MKEYMFDIEVVKRTIVSEVGCGETLEEAAADAKSKALTQEVCSLEGRPMEYSVLRSEVLREVRGEVDKV